MSEQMELVPGICTQCGATVQVDPRQEAAVCQYCGTPFIVERAVTNYNTVHLHQTRVQNTEVHHMHMGKRGAVESVMDFVDKQIERKHQAEENERRRQEEAKRREEEKQEEARRKKEERRKKTFEQLFARKHRKRNLIIAGVLLLLIVISSVRSDNTPQSSLPADDLIYERQRVAEAAERAAESTEQTENVEEIESPDGDESAAEHTETPPAESEPEEPPVETAPPESVEEVEEAPATIAESVVSPDFKAAMDSYEAFFDEYNAFMERFQNSDNSMELLSAYMSYMTRYADVMEKLDAIDENQLSDADSAYYLAVMARISAKMLVAAQ